MGSSCTLVSLCGFSGGLRPHIPPKGAVAAKNGRMSQEIYGELKRHFPVFYDVKGAVGRRYRRMDEAGTPFCLTVDGETLSEETVTLRERDSMKQTRLKVDEAIQAIREAIDC